MTRRYNRLFRAVSVGVCAAVVLQPARAGAVTIQASFAPIRMTAQAGQVLTTSYELKLQAGEPSAHFKVDVQDWWRSEDGQQSFYAAAGSLSRSCGSWVSTNPRESNVTGGETLHVRLSIAVPANVKPGGYWCALTVDELPDPLAATDEGIGVRFLASVSTGIYINVNPIERGADILGVEVSGDRAVARLANTGNTPVVVEGRFEFAKSGDARPIAVVELPRNVLLTEPIAVGSYGVDLPDQSLLPSGRYLIRLVVDIGLDHYIGVERELTITRGPISPRP